MRSIARRARRSRTGVSDKVITTATPAPGEHTQKRQLEKSVSWSGRERFRYLWYRLRLTVAEMNYATWRIADPRIIKLQAPLITDDHPSR